ncbi:MAG: MraY family glycosyltransferase [Candidatus Omnitrophica bacterium]|nr:MraY family glycosyltransferase [Candidatus Omnitrophota bacterium]MDD5652594.1 MraY family glycosyltransferase [Candidatus Omnitrophota bacterium]
MNAPIINLLIIFAAAFLSGLFLTFLLRRAAFKYGVFSRGDVAVVGGIALAAAFFLVGSYGLFIMKIFSKEIFGLFFSSLLMLTFGAIDDWKELSVGLKFTAQIICAFVLISFGVKTQIVYLGNVVNSIITVIWVLAITNAFNHLDIMDGVTAFTAAIIGAAFLLVAFLSHDLKVMVVSVAMIGSVLGFLAYNLPPARVYMGNAGSHFLGFLLSGLALTLSYAPMDKKMALVTPILILGFPIYDTLFLILMRLKKKKIPFKKSNDHLVLRCLAMGYSKKKALGFAIFWNLFFVFAAIITYRSANWQAAIAVAVVFLTALLLAKNMSRVSIND